MDFKQEIIEKKRFKFGQNWKNFLELLDAERINDAEKSLSIKLGVEFVQGKTFLDIGSGSGLFSLAAKNLGAKVYSFDYDPESVLCAKQLKKKYHKHDKNWTIEKGSVLNVDYMNELGLFDIVYSWGVLHHTGNMWKGLENAISVLSEEGILFISIYNSQGLVSKYWKFVKKAYVKYSWLRPFLVVIHLLYPVLPSIFLKVLLRKKIPRGMNFWHDLLDWLGGYPFEVAKPNEVAEFLTSRGLVEKNMDLVGRKSGCNEYIFVKQKDKF